MGHLIIPNNEIIRLSIRKDEYNKDPQIMIDNLTLQLWKAVTNTDFKNVFNQKSTSCS